MQIGEFVAFQTFSSCDGGDPPRAKRYASRSKKGCLTCRRQRRVKCDETRPVCRRCMKAQVSCIYSKPVAHQSPTTSSQVRSSLTVFRTSHEHNDLQFWLESGSHCTLRWHNSSFYEHLLPQFSEAHESARYSLLALSTCVHQWHLPSGDPRETVLDRGNQYYNTACAELLKSNSGRASIEAALVSSLALFAYDSFTNHMTRRHIHSNAAIALLRLLKQGFSYNKTSGWRSENGKAGTQVVIEAAETYFNEISYSISGEGSNPIFENADATPLSRTKIYVPIWLQLDSQSAALPIDQASTAASSLQSPSAGWTIVRVAPESMQDCHNHLVLWHCWLFTWLITTSISAQQLRRSQSLCKQWHTWLFRTMRPGTTEMHSMQNRAQILDQLFEVRLVDAASQNERPDVQSQLDSILALVEKNVEMFDQATMLRSRTSSRHTQDYHPQQFLRGLAKVIEYVFRRADDFRIQDKAYAIFSLRKRRKPEKT